MSIEELRITVMATPHPAQVPTRRSRQKAELDAQIRAAARALLAAGGTAAVGLRAIAREVGITAPALFRYYDSLDALLTALREEVDQELAQAIHTAAAAEPDLRQRPFVLGRAFRSWALANRQEFDLLFSTTGARIRGTGEVPVAELLAQDTYALTFFRHLVEMLAARAYLPPPDDSIPERLRGDLAASHAQLLDAFAHLGIDNAGAYYTVGADYFLTRAWVRLFGHVALEIYTPQCFGMLRPAALFEEMLAELVGELRQG